MQQTLVLCLAFALLIGSPARGAEPSVKTKNVFFIVSDGLRWQEVFTGAEEALLNKTNGGVRNVEVTRKKFWRETPAQRRSTLMPFLWSEIAQRGQIFGNQHIGSFAKVTNPHRFSYPGYNEMLSGIVAPRIDSNKKFPNPNITVFEWLQTKTSFQGRSAVLASWDVFPWIFNAERSGLPIWPVFDSGIKPQINPSPRVQEMFEDTAALWDELIFDSFLYHTAVDHVRAKKPRAVFLGFGETDQWAHEGRYDLYLHAARHFDDFVKRLWNLVQSLPEYKDQTTFILTTDHGRGGGLSSWKDHGAKVAGAEAIWVAVLGPDTPALGERTNSKEIYLNQIPATMAALLGEKYNEAFPKAGPPIQDVLPL